MKAKHCDECKHFNDEDVPGTKVCEKNHKPRWYGQKHVEGNSAGACARPVSEANES